MTESGRQGAFPGRLRHAAMMLAVHDVEASVAFCRDVLGSLNAAAIPDKTGAGESEG